MERHRLLDAPSHRIQPQNRLTRTGQDRTRTLEQRHLSRTRSDHQQPTLVDA